MADSTNDTYVYLWGLAIIALYSGLSPFVYQAILWGKTTL